jgi:hypothetical protein
MSLSAECLWHVQYLFPLLFLLLGRHLRIIRLGSTYILHPSELKSAIQSIIKVSDAVTDRIGALTGLCVYSTLSLSSADLHCFIKRSLAKKVLQM